MDISNKTLAILVILAIIVSLVGLFIGRARIVTIGRPIETGEVQATLTEDVNIIVTGTPINFLTVYGGDRISSESHCGVDATCETGDDVYDGSCLEGPDLDTECNKPFPDTTETVHFLNVSSIGVTQTNIKYYADESLFCREWNGISAGLENGVIPGDRDEEDASFQVKAKITSVAGGYDCDLGIDSAGDPFTDMVFKTVDLPLANEQGIALGCVQYDRFDMYFKIKVPVNEPATCTQLSTLTFTGSATT